MYKGMKTVEMNFQFHFEILHFTGTEQTSYEITICKTQKWDMWQYCRNTSREDLKTQNTSVNLVIVPAFPGFLYVVGLVLLLHF